MGRTLVVCAVLAAVLCPSALAGQGLLVGVSEDGMKWSPERGVLTARYMYRLGIGAVRVTIRWSPGQSVPRGPTLIALRRAIRTAGHRRLVLAVYSRARRAPVIARHRRQYCGFVGRLLLRTGRVRDVVIWNEPNSGRFWRPQFTPDGADAAAHAYEALLAECWDELHALRPDVNVIAASAPRGNDESAALRPSHSPLRWYQDLGAPARAVGRASMYQIESPALAGRARQTPGSAPVVDQASQLSDAIRLAYCQPYVGAFFNFLLADERTLTGWQSGLLWANWEPKPSYYRVRDAVFDVVDRRVHCSQYPSAAPAS